MSALAPITGHYAVAVLWINTYKLDSLAPCIQEFDRRTAFDACSYFHFIMDSSIGEEASVCAWVAAEQERRNRGQLPPVFVAFTDRPLGCTSKKNLAFELLKSHADVLVELEDDVCIEAPDPYWLAFLVQTLVQDERKGHRLFWMFENVSADPGLSPEEAGSQFICAAWAMTMATREYVGPYPSELTGDFVNPVEEMRRFPLHLKRVLFEEKKLRPFMVEKIVVVYDLGAKSVNFIRLVADSTRRTDWENWPLAMRSAVYAQIDGLATAQKFDRYDMLPNAGIHSQACITHTLRRIQTAHLFLRLPDYRFLQFSILLTVSELQQFRSLLEDPSLWDQLQIWIKPYFGFQAVHGYNPVMQTLDQRCHPAMAYLAKILT